jgi:hypothetical protein
MRVNVGQPDRERLGPNCLTQFVPDGSPCFKETHRWLTVRIGRFGGPCWQGSGCSPTILPLLHQQADESPTRLCGRREERQLVAFAWVSRLTLERNDDRSSISGGCRKRKALPAPALEVEVQSSLPRQSGRDAWRVAHVCTSGSYSSSGTSNVHAIPAFAVRVSGGTRNQ